MSLGAALLFVCATVSQSSTVLDPGDLKVRFHTQPEVVEVGEPFALVLDIHAPTEASVRDAVVGEPVFDGSWVLLGERKPAPFVDPDDADRRVVRRAWDLVSLEPGTRSLTDALSGVTYSSDVKRIELGGASLMVSSVLEEGEDEPRPMRAFPPGFGEAPPQLGDSPWILALGILAVVFWGVVLALVARRFLSGRRRSAPTPPTPLEAFGRLESEAALEEERLRERHFELTRLVRRAADARAAEGSAPSLEGLSDEEWLERGLPAAGLPGAAHEPIRFVLERASEVKYGGRVPTEWAFRETLEKARAALEICARPAREEVAR